MTRDELDYYPTPFWATEVMLEFLYSRLPIPPSESEIFEPCCGYGHIAHVLGTVGWDVTTNDINPRIDADMNRDFIRLPEEEGKTDWIITNPPYETPEYHAADFVRKALKLANKGVVMLLRLSFLEPCQNRFGLLRDFPPSLELVIPRPRYVDGSTDSVTSVWLYWIKEDGRWLPLQEEGRGFVPPFRRPSLENRQTASPDRESQDPTKKAGFLEGVI